MSTSRSASSHLTFSPPERGPSFPKLEESRIVGSSAAIKRVRQQVRRIGPHFRTVLVSGEAGTGKELVARTLHGISPAAEGPFVVCPAMTGRDIPPLKVEGFVKRSVPGTLFLD